MYVFFMDAVDYFLGLKPVTQSPFSFAVSINIRHFIVSTTPIIQQHATTSKQKKLTDAATN